MSAATDHLAVAREVLAAEAGGIAAASAGLGNSFNQAVDLLLATTGKVVLTGIGKSGHVARKMVATLASTGTPAFFLHPAEAVHGDLGMISAGDTLVALSHSGVSTELSQVVEYGRRQGNRLIILTGNPDSKLAHAADACIAVAVVSEACPHNLAPTASTTATMAIGDALAMALVAARGFSPEDFARTHPGGELGRRLLERVRDLMLTGAALPTVPTTATLADAIVEMNVKRLGMTMVLDAGGGLAGIFTDGDLRRCLKNSGDIHGQDVAAGMCTTPKTIAPDRLASEAIALMEEHRITHLPAVCGGKAVGLIDIHLLMQHRIA